MSAGRDAERVEQLMSSFAAAGPLVQNRVEELVSLVVELHGAGLERLLEIADESGALTDGVLDRIADDEQVSALLLLHGLHPDDVHTRIERALDRVRPYMGSHGGDVSLVEVDGGLVRLRMLGNCQGCPSSNATLELAVEGAVRAAAPEIEDIECDATAEEEPGPALISSESLFSRVRADQGGDEAAGRSEPASTWQTLDLDDLAPGTVRAMTVGGAGVVVCRVGTDTYAYRDRCARCRQGLEGAGLQRIVGSPSGGVAMVCPHCRAHFDVRRAGAEVAEADTHLEPLPLLDDGGLWEIALPREVPA
ncbi:NifU family protein [Nocardiopsis salina]|uniref:NifU family protein n=1 Tax=Nocardiopsis salina TaxID=245836 RepID=UPI000345827A|nr:NifU family protein [Nocardiopsis salina]